MKAQLARIGGLLWLALLLATAATRERGQAQAEAPGPRGLSAREVELALTLSPLPPLPADPSNAFADDPRAARLGQHLFFDPALSGNGEIACATCHDPALDFTDGKPVAEGLERGTRRTAPLWNLAWSSWYFWDGRAGTLWSQALGPLENEHEMGGDRLAIAHHLASEPALARAYEELFGALPELADPERFPARAKPMPERPDDPRHQAWSGMGAEDQRAIERVFVHVGKALAAYERRLVRVDAPFDRFVEGLRSGDEEQLATLSEPALRGLSIFLGRGNCRLCHAGPTFSDGEFHDISLPTEGGGLPRDPGRYEGLRLLRADPFGADGPYADGGVAEARALLSALERSSERWGEFKTPSLRNLALTGPFMHAGHFSSLREVLHFYSTREGAAPAHRHQELVLTPFELSPQESDDLVRFLESLQGVPREPALSMPLDLRAGG